VIDSQSVRAADTVPKATRGWDKPKKVNGRKRHIAVDTMGLLLAVVITAASVQDRDAARPLPWNLHRTCRRIRLIWADAVYTGKLASWAATLKMTIQIVARRNPHAFEVLPRRWVVERTFAWISKHRRTTRDYERLPASHEAMIVWAMIALMTRRLAQPALLQTMTQPRWLTHTDMCAGSRACCTTPARSPRTESRSTASFSRAANAATIWSASYRARLNRRSTARCTRRRSGLNKAAAISVEAATATEAWNRSTWVASSTTAA
jgi:transposase